jgi:hypothetical protein
MRIGTWNLGTRRDASPSAIERQLARQVKFMAREDCDLWLLTEVPLEFEMAPGASAFSEDMKPGGVKMYAAVWAKDGLKRLDVIHEAAAFAQFGDLRVCSCVLPWPSMCLEEWPDKHTERAVVTQMAIHRVGVGLDHGTDLVWGGDWNQTLHGKITTKPGRRALSGLIAALGVKVPTAQLAHTDGGAYCSIDHIAVPNSWNVTACGRLVARGDDDKRLSDHDAYVIEAER